MSIMKYLCKLVLLVSALLPACLQAAEQDTYVFRHLNNRNGLSSNNVKTILKDSEGFLWIGTENGLNRYDGYNIKVYQPDSRNPHSIFTNDIWSLQEDGFGNLWVGTGPIYTVYNRDKDCFINNPSILLREIGIPADREYRIHTDREHNLWVIQGKEIFRYDISRKELKSFRIEEIPETNTDFSICDDGKSLYILWNPRSLWKVDSSSGTCEPIMLMKCPPSTTDRNIFHIYVDLQGGLWCYSYVNEWIFYRKDSRSAWKRIELHSKVSTNSNAVRSIQDDANGHVWIGTDHKGLFIYDYVNDTLTNLLNDPTAPTSPASNRFNTIYRDESGVIWLGNFKKGISYCHDRFHEFISSCHHLCGDIAAILEDKAGNIWLGTDGNGLYVEEKQKGYALRKLPLPDVAIVCLEEDHKGRIWAGSYQDGLFCLENGRVRHLTPENSPLPHKEIVNLKEDRYGNLWIGSVRQPLVCYNPDLGTVSKHMYPDGHLISALDFYYDHGDKMYIGTTYGLCVMDITTKKAERLFTNREGTRRFRQEFVSTVFKDDKDILWLGHKQGLTAWDLRNDSLYCFDTTDGLCDNLVKSILQDNRGNIWIATSNGLSALEITPDTCGSFSFTFKNLSIKDGLSDNYFNTHSACKLASGDLLLGNANGYTSVNPNKQVGKPLPPSKAYFTSLTIGNRRIEVDSIYEGRKLLTKVIGKTTSLTVRHDDNLICLELAAGHLLNAEKTSYAYKLEGMDKQWYHTNEHKITFTTLPPGKYKLQVKACSSEGDWNDEPTRLDITVLPPFYLSGGAVALYALLLALFLAYGAWHIRKSHRKKLEQQRQKLEQSQKLLLNEMKLKFFTNISHDLRTPLTLIISPLQMLLSEEKDETVHKKLEIIHKNAQQLLKLINSLLDFRKLDVGAETIHCKSGDIVRFVREVCNTFQEYAIGRGIRFSFMCEIDSLDMSFDPVKIEKVINNLLSNAFKYTPDKGEVNVHLYCENDDVCICVADNGQGITDKDKKHIFERFYQVAQPQEKTGSGIGLHIANEYVHLHNGSITVADNFPKGTVFTVKLPITASAGEKEELYPEDAQKNRMEKSTTPPSASKTQYTILFVDDNKDFCTFMAECLSQEYEVLTAHNGMEALKVLETNDTDINIVVSDVMMPVMNGMELLRQIKTNVQWSHIPVILLTARAAEEYKTEGFEQGADDYIVKPFDFNLLKLRIRKFIEWTEKCHHQFSRKVEVAPNEITITPLDEQFISKAIKIVEEHMSNPDFSVETLGAELGLSRSHLYKKLMCITGKGPAEFIRIIRLKRSKQLLEKSQLQIAEIAYEVGFNSPKRFTINFKNEFGISPSDYIRNLK